MRNIAILVVLLLTLTARAEEGAESCGMLIYTNCNVPQKIEVYKGERSDSFEVVTTWVDEGGGVHMALDIQQNHPRMDLYYEVVQCLEDNNQRTVVLDTKNGNCSNTIEI